MSKFWTPGRVEALRKHAADGLSGAQSAKLLGDGCTRNMVGAKRHRLGLKSKSGVLRLLYGLEERGLVVWDRGRARSLRIIDRPSVADLERLTDDDLRAVMNDAIDVLNRRCDAEGRA
jgi:SOS-response transcriptional repressor LexA